MIESIVKVKSTTTLQGKKGSYLSVVWTDGNKEFKKNVFDPSHQKVFQQAEKSGESVKVGVEKEGNFFNVKSAEITSETTESKSNGRYYHDRHSQDAEDWTNIRTAVMQSVQLETHHIAPEGKIDIGRVMQNANEIFASMIMMKPKREDA